MGCSVTGCPRTARVRGLCSMHYQRVQRRHPGQWPVAGPTAADLAEGLDSFVNPMVCDCTQPLADPAKNWGQCARCKRKPLALMAVS